MDFITYEQSFHDILNAATPPAPYDHPGYLNYVKLNWSRQQRWLKSGILNPELVNVIETIRHPQIWTVITEPWCGDAAHTIPFIQRLASANPHIKVDYVLRDTPPFLIEQYLTNGSKSIPKLIIADENKKDIAVWGPRPSPCQELFFRLRANHVEYEEEKIALQMWYNEDKGVTFQVELLEILRQKLQYPSANDRTA